MSGFNFTTIQKDVYQKVVSNRKKYLIKDAKSGRLVRFYIAIVVRKAKVVKFNKVS